MGRNEKEDPADLRQRAEKELAARPEPPESEMSADQARAVLHELRTHEVELELQNEELRRTQDELAEARDRFMDLFDFAPVGYVTVDPGGRILEANLTLADMLRANRRDLVGRSLSDWVEDDDRGLLDQLYEDLLRSGERQDCELRMKGHDGTPLWAGIDARPFDRAPDGAQFRLAVADVTERRTTEERQRDLEAALAQARRLESLGLLAGGVAHDFNNLLQGVLSHAEIALCDLPENSPLRTELLEIEQSAVRAGELAEQMLAYAGKRTLTVQPVDLSELVRDLRPILDTAATTAGGRQVTTRYQFADGLPAVRADATQLRQVVLNLVTNAAEAIGREPGTIAVSTSVHDCDAAFLGGAVERRETDERPAGRYVRLSVADTGRGMDATTRANAFEPFFSTKFIGRGLGLAAMQGIVRAHRGAIFLDSSPRRGTTIDVYLPALA